MPKWFFRSPGPDQVAFALMREDMCSVWIEHYQTTVIDHEGFHRRVPMRAGDAYALWRWRRSR